MRHWWGCGGSFRWYPLDRSREFAMFPCKSLHIFEQEFGLAWLFSFYSLHVASGAVLAGVGAERCMVSDRRHARRHPCAPGPWPSLEVHSWAVPWQLWHASSALHSYSQWVAARMAVWERAGAVAGAGLAGSGGRSACSPPHPSAPLPQPSPAPSACL